MSSTFALAEPPSDAVGDPPVREENRPIADPDEPAPPSPLRAPNPICPDPLPLTLDKALELSLASSPSLDKQLSVIRQRDYEVEEAYTQANPRIDFVGQYQRIEPPVSIPGGTVISPPNNYSFGLTIQQPIYTFGRLRFSTLAAKLSKRSAQETYLNSLQEVIQGGADLYIQALVAEEALTIAEDELEAQRANLRVTELLNEQGVVARFDVLRTGAAASQAEQALIDANTNRELASSRLKSFMGLNLEQALNLQPLALQPPMEVELQTEQEAILERRTDLRALRWAIESARARVNLERAQSSPTLALQNSTIQRNATGFNPGLQNTTALVLQIPLFDGGVSESRAQQAEEVVTQLVSDLEQAERDVVLQSKEAYRTLQDRWRAIEVAQENVTQADEALRVAVLRYENGVSTNVELLDTQAARSQARFGLANAVAEYQRARWRWRRAAGADFTVEVPLPEEIRQRIEKQED